MKTQSKTGSVFHHLIGAAKIVIGSIIGALVLVFFWHPVIGFFKAVFEKADSIFPGK